MRINPEKLVEALQKKVNSHNLKCRDANKKGDTTLASYEGTMARAISEVLSAVEKSIDSGGF